MKRTLITGILLFLLFSLYGQEARRHMRAVKINDVIRIDGILDEPSWSTASGSGEFIQREPYNGKKARFLTEMKIMYDNTGLYAGIMMQDPAPDSIPSQMGLRDSDDLNADHVILLFSPFNDGINAFCFQVWVSDVQTDFKISGIDSENDYSWDAVWVSKARRNEHGWVAEVKIPYSAIRFPGTEVQEWGLNCQRLIRRFRETDTWNFIDARINGEVNQSGILEGIRDIRPPLRLSFSPYLSGYLQNTPDDKDYAFSYNYGADLKYGINESYTLDMTLIPDFGQTSSDDIIYNFSPFEVKYAEKRQFFTEGTEMFNKGGIFYSRRVGREPRGAKDVDKELAQNEVVSENPGNTKLLNAAKISGRSAKGLGIGVFNAVSGNTWAMVRDTLSGTTRRVLTQGFTNYSVLALDKNLKNNSFIDILNTNYFLPQEGYTANVSGTAFRLANRKYTYALNGEGFVSQQYYSHQSPDFGLRYLVSFQKISGNFRFEATQELQTDKYNPNDMGFNAVNNFFDNSVTFQYNVYDPFWKLLNWYNQFQISYNTLYKDFRFTDFTLSFNSFATTQKHLTLGMTGYVIPVAGYDYYEPRVDGWKFRTPENFGAGGFVSTDYRKRIAFDLSLSGDLTPEFKGNSYTITLRPRFRISDRLFTICEIEFEEVHNEVGYVDDQTGPGDQVRIIFGRRDRTTVSNVIEANYMITSAMSVNLRARQYRATANYLTYFDLQPDGSLVEATYDGNADINYNNFNIDFTYIWNFAPGSQVSVMWKKAVNSLDHDATIGFFEDFSRTVSAGGSNSFSLRVLYYLDALYFKKKNRKKAGE